MRMADAEISVRKGCGSASAASIHSFQKHFLCSVPPLEEDDDDHDGDHDSGLVDNPVSVARKSLYSKDNFSCVKIPSRSQDSKVGVLECCSPRAVLEGPGSSAESEAGSSPTSTSYAVDIEANAWTALPTTRETLGNVPLPTAADDGAGFCSMSSLIPQQKHCIQGLWRSFATKRWQSFPSSYRKKEMAISDPILVNPEDVEEDSFGQQDAAHSLLSAAGNQRRSWKTFTHEEISLATNNFDPGNPLLY